MSYSAQLVAAASLILSTVTTNAQFTGDYAPDTWTVTGAGIGGSSATFAMNGTSLTITGSDGGFGNETDVTHAVFTGGMWTFDWWYVSEDYSGFDIAYYLLNGSPVFLSDAFATADTGSVSIPVTAGDVIGWRVDSVDGIFGAGTLVITNFQIPAPGLLPLLGFIGLLQTRRRR